ncbi:hypothetical protein IT400_01080 [Candidatus Nomurabacteria bacterium]|nr:hypothetical protein [Candidatus Nomurabacteria bacterium]
MKQKIKLLTWIRTNYPELFEVCFSNKRLDGTKILVPENESLSNTDFLSVVKAVGIFEEKILTTYLTQLMQGLQNLLVNEPGTEKFEAELKICAEETKEHERRNDNFMKTSFFPALIRVYNDNASDDDIVLIQERFVSYEKIRLGNLNVHAS